MNINIEFQYADYLVMVDVEKKFDVNTLDITTLDISIPDYREYIFLHKDGLPYIINYFSQYRNYHHFVEENYEDMSSLNGVTEFISAINKNPSAVRFLRSRRDFIDVKYLVLNESIAGMELVKEILPKCDKEAISRSIRDLSTNPYSYHIFKNMPELLCIRALCYNRSKWAIKLLEAHNIPENISTYGLSCNPFAKQFIIDNIHYWKNIKGTIFGYNYDHIKNNRSELHLELMSKYYFNPNKIVKWMNENPNTELEEYVTYCDKMISASSP